MDTEETTDRVDGSPAEGAPADSSPTSSANDCKSAQSGGGYCAKDVLKPETDFGLKYWVCPRDPEICKDMTLIAKRSTDMLIIDSPDFLDNEICNYQVKFPIDAGFSDTISISFVGTDNIGISFGVGNSFTTAQGGESLLDPEEFDGKQLLDPADKQFTVSWPATFFFSVFSTNAKRSAKFILRYQF